MMQRGMSCNSALGRKTKRHCDGSANNGSTSATLPRRKECTRKSTVSLHFTFYISHLAFNILAEYVRQKNARRENIEDEQLGQQLGQQHRMRILRKMHGIVTSKGLNLLPWVFMGSNTAVTWAVTRRHGQ